MTKDVAATLKKFSANVMQQDDTPLMAMARRDLSDLDIAADDLRAKLEKAIEGMTRKNGKGETVRAEWPQAKLDMICAGATRADAADLQAKAEELAKRPGVTANSYHHAAYIARQALDMPSADAGTLSQAAAARFKPDPMVEVTRRKATTAFKSFQKAMAAFATELEASGRVDKETYEGFKDLMDEYMSGASGLLTTGAGPKE